ncbi:MAG: ATP-binding protein [Planctomycetes bacterium]|nr:ATP-binding protein [Planctomycetota bacterium]
MRSGTAIPFPFELLTLHTAIVGKTRSGKTNSAKVIIEELAKRGERVCIIDPIKSDHYGLTSSANGKSPGLPFTILGGPFGHIPLHGDAGAALGKLVAHGDLPLSILDMCELGPREFGRFYVQFAETLFRNMKGVLYLVIEEAHIFAPKERIGDDQENMRLHWTKRLAEAGGSRGIRLIVATQTVQKLHNEVLGACDPVIAHRMVLPAQVKPIRDWIAATISKPEADEVAKSLPSLKTGEAWVYSGEHQHRARVQFPKIWTFDNSKTPESGQQGRTKLTTAAVDLEHLRGVLGEAIAEAQANDPKALRKEIEDLKRKLQAAAAAPAAPAPVDTAERDQLAARVNALQGYSQGLSRYGQRLRGGVTDALIKIEDAVRILNGLNVTDVPSYTEAAKAVAPVPAPAPRTYRPAQPSWPSDLTGPEQRILDAAAFFSSVGDAQPRRAAVAIVAGYSSISGGAFANPCGALRSKGLITYPSSDQIALTDDGRAKARASGPRSLSEFHELLLSMLPGPEARILRPLIDNGGRPMSREKNAEAAGYTSTSGGAYANPLGSLRSRGFIDYPDRSSVVALPVLFPNLGGVR